MLRRADAPSLWSAQQGAVYAEALVCFPAFLALLLAVIGLHGMYSGKLEAKSRARRAAWLQADSGDCAQNSCPDCRPGERRIAAEAFTPIEEVQTSGHSLSKFGSRLSSQLFGRSTDGVGEVTVDMPKGMGGAGTRMRGLTTLPCNTRGRQGPNIESALRDACEGGLAGVELAAGACAPR